MTPTTQLCPDLYCPFSFFQRPARTAGPIFTLYCSNNVVQPKDGLFGVRMMSDITWWKCAPKTHPKGRWIGIFKPSCRNLKIAVSPKSETIHPVSPKFDDVGGLPLPKWNTTWLTSAILKIDITSGRRRFDSCEIWYADAKSDADDDLLVKVETWSKISIWRPFIFRNRK